MIVVICSPVVISFFGADLLVSLFAAIAARSRNSLGLYHRCCRLGFIICITNRFPSRHLFKFLNSSLHFNVCLPFFIVSTPVQILSILLQKLRRNPFQILSSLSLLSILSTPLLFPWTLGHLIMKRWVG